MVKITQGVSRYAVVLAILMLPLILLASSVLTFRELDKMRAVYLRNRAATIASWLESADLSMSIEDLLDSLSIEEPALVDLQIHDSPQQTPDDPVFKALWNSEVLFHAGQITINGENLFRAYIPFRTELGLHIARIDLEMTAADFLIVYARNNVLVAFVSGLVLVLFAVYFLWSGRRAARLERRQVELEHLARLGEMSAVLAHEIRNPLGAIKGFVQLASEKADQATGALLDPVIEETTRLERLVNDLLLYGRPRTPDIRSVKWEQFTGQLAPYAADVIGERPISFICERGMLNLKTDPDMLVQVLLNLIRNSVEALEDAGDGEVHLKACQLSNGGLSISVEDNGPGIPEENRARLFEPFFTAKSNGTGLGLSIARKLTEALGGRLEIRSLTPRGTRAELTFR